MTLEQYLSLDGSMSPTQLCEKIGLSKGRLSQLRVRDDQPIPDFPARVAMDLERVTDGKIDAAMISSVVKDARQSARAA